MLKTLPTGYTLPIAPSGQASLVKAPPWYFSGEFTWIDYRVDPELAAGFLPPGLSLGPDAGMAAAAFSRWQWCTGDRMELDDPAQNQFTELMILLGCEHDGRPVARCPLAWVDHAIPLVRGWVQGMPKQFGTVRMTNAITAGIAGPRLEPGGTFHASLAAADRRIVTGRVNLVHSTTTPPHLNNVPLVHSRLFPAWDPAGPTLEELVSSRVADVEYGPIWEGEAELTFGPDAAVAYPDLVALLPTGVRRGYVFSYGETLVGGTHLTA
jgi:acetoacetate decarboxylase